GIRDFHVTGVQTCALPISLSPTALLALSSTHRSQPSARPSTRRSRSRPAFYLRGIAAIGPLRSAFEVLRPECQPALDHALLRIEIGRASCRERVVIWWVVD